MNESELILRYWHAWRIAIENHVIASNRNENDQLMRCLAKVIDVCEADFHCAQSSTALKESDE